MKFNGNITLLLAALLASLSLESAAGILIILPSGRISGRVVPLLLIRKEDFLA
jgi:hypothetical protein